MSVLAQTCQLVESGQGQWEQTEEVEQMSFDLRVKQETRRSKLIQETCRQHFKVTKLKQMN